MTPDTRSMFDPKSYSKVLRPPLQAEPLPGWCYTSEEFYRREIEQVFSRNWICLGREDALPRVGDYRAFEFCGKKLILVRSAENRISLLDNVCRHRGTLLLTGSGNTNVILCPFHHWGYGLDGVLRGAPAMEQTEGFHKSDYGLRAYEVTLWNGFIFARLVPGGPSLEEAMGDMDGLVATYKMGDMTCARQKVFTVACNWKLFIEVFMEDYHLKAVHKSSIAGTYTAPEPLERLNGDFATIFNPHQGTSALLTGEQHLALPPIAGLTGKAAAGTRYLFFYPSFAYACTVDCMWFFEIYPEGPSRTRVAMNMCFPRSTVARQDFAEKFAAYEQRWDVSMKEDLVVLELQQQGLETDQYSPGRLSHLEPVVGMFANWLIRHAVEMPRDARS
jgi:phenylpropionate dioxygenase-like ring-hydroxylating dioxygenase large terminal subunit